ncbi:MAG: hypothetical protein ACI4JJ_04265 [Huintestinicola sp.]
MSFADYIALGIILFLMFCAVRYLIVSSKKGRHIGCSGCCSQCGGCCNKDNSSLTNSSKKDDE